MNDLRERMERINRQRKKIQITAVGMMLCLVLAVAFYAYHMPVMTCVIGGGALLFYVLWLRGQMALYRDAVSEAQVLYGLCGGDASAQFTGKTRMTREAFEALQMLPLYKEGNPLLLRQGFECKLRGFQIAGHEMTIHYPKAGSTGKQFFFLNGTLLSASVPGLHGDCLLLHNDMLDKESQVSFLMENGYKRIPVTGKYLKENDHLYAHHEGVLTEKMESAISTLAEKIPMLGALRISDGMCTAYLYNRFYTSPVRLRETPDEEMLTKNRMTELEDFVGFLETLTSMNES